MTTFTRSFHRAWSISRNDKPIKERKITMKKTFKLQDLECANCAAKMETEINKLDGVEAAVSFMSQKMTVSAPDEDFDGTMKKIAKICKKIEPDCEILM